MSMYPTYTVGIQRHFFPYLYRKYKVIGHDTEIVGLVARMVLKLPDGSFVFIPRLDKKRVKLYPDYREAAKIIAANKQPKIVQEQQEHAG